MAVLSSVPKGSRQREETAHLNIKNWVFDAAVEMGVFTTPLACAATHFSVYRDLEAFSDRLWSQLDRENQVISS